MCIFYTKYLVVSNQIYNFASKLHNYQLWKIQNIITSTLIRV